MFFLESSNNNRWQMSLYHPTSGYIYSIYNLQQNGLQKNCKFEDLLLQEPTVPNVLQGISLTFAVLILGILRCRCWTIMA